MKNGKMTVILTVVMFAVIVVLAVQPAQAVTLTIPYAFGSGVTISSSQMNSNFSAIASAVNANRVVWAYNTGCGTTCAATTAGVGGVVNVNQISITATGPGLILVGFNGTPECTPSSTYYFITMYGQIVTSSTAQPYGYMEGGAMVRANLTNVPTYFNIPMNTRRAFQVAGAGTYTYYYNMSNWAGATGPRCTMFGGNMEAIFIPTP